MNELEIVSLKSKVNWDPIYNGGANFRSIKLKKESTNYMLFVTSRIYIIFFGFFIFCGGVLLYGSINKTGENNNDSSTLLIFSILFSLVGIIAFFIGKTRIEIKVNENNLNINKGSLIIKDLETKKISNIIALQIIKKRIGGDADSNDYFNYEINAVDNYFERHYILNDYNLESIDNYSNKLSAFLHVPIIKN